MNWQLLCFILLLVGCAHEPVTREPAMEEEFRPGVVSHAHSSVQLFPASSDGNKIVFNFYVQFKNEKGLYVDSDPMEIQLKNKKGVELPLEWKRLAVGRYYFILEHVGRIPRETMNFYIGKRVLKENISLVTQKLSEKHTQIQLVSRHKRKLTLRLRLADERNQPVDVHYPPDLILEGLGEIKDLRRIQKGIWEFSLVYSEFNQIFYLSVRAQDTYFSNIFRYQYVEK